MSWRNVHELRENMQVHVFGSGLNNYYGLGRVIEVNKPIYLSGEPINVALVRLTTGRHFGRIMDSSDTVFISTEAIPDLN